MANHNVNLLGAKVKHNYFLTCYYNLCDARNECRSIGVERSEKKSRSLDLRDTHLTYFCIFWFVGLVLNLPTKFEGSSYTHSIDTEGVPKF